jgi:hypothetical protein
MMKQNRSLAISSKLQEFKMGDVVGLLEHEFPASIFGEINEQTKRRNRVFTNNNTLLTMLLTSVQEDKTLKNSVDLFYLLHQKRKEQVRQELEQVVQMHRDKECEQLKKQVGRPRKYKVQIPRSLEKDISLNTAAYSKARDRVPIELTESLFNSSLIDQAKNSYSHWHGYRVFEGDGTFVQMQDTPTLRKMYEVRHNGIGSEGYPQGLLEVVIERGTGQLFRFRLSNRHVSELAMFYEMLDDMPAGSLLLLDDLYNCFEIISKCQRLGIELVVPAKRIRNYEVVEKISEGDEIIRISTPKNRSKWLEHNEPAQKILLRRMECRSPDGTDYVLITTILNKNITKEEFHMLYLTRWDIEISIEEIKIIMDVNVLRSKTPEMVLKELNVSLAAYNLIRKIIYASIKDLPFSPKDDFIHQFYSINQAILIDKKGRVYDRWSPGRRRIEIVNSEANTASQATKQKI